VAADGSEQEAAMLESHQVEELICVVASLDKRTLTEQFLTFRGTFPVDFTPEFLQALPLDRMRHIFVALCLQAQAMPVTAVPAAA
jgi:hypothetical protein